MTEFYKSQPAELPLTLPAGTRITYSKALFARSEVRLRGEFYVGHWSEFDAPGEGMYPSSIDWSSVPLPTQAVEAPPAWGTFRCKVCSRHTDNIYEHQLSSEDRWYCASCYQIAARNSKLNIAESNRPIQAGDWVECVQQCGTPDDGTSPGERFVVAKVTDFLDVPGFELKGRKNIWLASRFKRVDGPRPAVADEGPEPVLLHAGADNGSPGYLHYLGLSDNLCSTPECAARGVVATENGQCVYCACSTSEGTDTRAESDAVLRWSTDQHPRNVEPRKRLAAWELAGKPRVRNAADAKAFALPHPWPEFDEMESR